MIPPEGYHADPARHDELLDGHGRVRAPWAAVLRNLEVLGAAELARRQRVAQRMLVAEHSGHALHQSVTTGGLDPLPTVIEAQEWAVIEAGIAQRTRVIEATLADLYGPRRLVLDGVVPPEALFGTRALQVAMMGVHPGHRWLTTYGADLVRGADGQWLVLKDHTDAPGGAGYALMNRIVLSRLLPDALRDLRVRPLGPWFTELRRALAAIAPPQATSPRTVVLGPGADHPDFVETSYLATQLGYHLAHGDDLAVRQGRVWLRALDGLEPIDVILRRVPDRLADPVELGPSGAGGVAGLAGAVRAGGVGVANALGSGLADRLWLQPFLDGCSRALLGEPLRLATIDTWWCGDPEVRHRVLADLGGHVLHDTDPAGPHRSAFGSQLSEDEARHWQGLLAHQPHRVVAQPTLDFATTPVLDQATVVPGRGTVRVHAVCTDEAVVVLPGGQGRRVTGDQPVVELAGAQGKDVWVLDAGHRPAPVVLRPVELPQVDLRDSLPTRAAEALWWLGRNAERAELAARLAKIVVQRAEQHPELLDGEWVERATGGLRAVSGALGTAPADGLFGELAGCLGERPGAMADSLVNLGGNAASVREFLSTTTWQIVNDLSGQRAEVLRAVDKDDWFVVVEGLERVGVSLAALAGLANESMVRGPGWRFGDLGRRLERALATLALVEATVCEPCTDDVVEPVYATVLAALESLVAYRRRYRSDLRLEPLVELVISDPDNPRSLEFALRRLAEHLTELPRVPGVDRHQDLVAAARAAASPAVLRSGDTPLAAVVLAVRGPLLELTGSLATTWFVHPAAHRMQG